MDTHALLVPLLRAFMGCPGHGWCIATRHDSRVPSATPACTPLPNLRPTASHPARTPSSC